MKTNGKVQLIGEKVILVPYKECHVIKYHEWMQSPLLQELTASEPLTLKEEYQMQKSWYEDADKCTFIVLDKKQFEETGSEVESMIGDTNLYMSSDEDVTTAEGEIMIAESSFKGQRRGWEAMLLMFRYGVECLDVKKYQVKIGMANTPSLSMFKKMKFEPVSESQVFQEVTLETEVDMSWNSWLTENTKHYAILPHENEDLKVEKMCDSKIRSLKLSDCKSLLVLMQEFSKEVHGTSLVSLTLQGLEEDFSKELPIFTIYVSHDSKDKLLGYILFYYTYSTWEGRSVCVEELYVLPSYRKTGIGSSLLRQAVQTAVDKGCCRININTFPENSFLISQGAVDLTYSEKWLFFRMDKDALIEFSKRHRDLEGVTIREATRGDSTGVRKLIQDLADYEKLPDGPKIDALTIEEDGHGSDVFYKCYVAETDGHLIGYSLFFFTYSGEGPGVYMEDLYVAPEHRRKGIGMALWGNVVKACLDLNGNRCDFAVLDWNAPSIEFYKLMGAKDMTQGNGFHFYRMVRDVMVEYAKVK